MAQCPECLQEQNVDFGMATCTQCGTVFMVEIDGSVSLPAEVGPTVEEEIFEHQDSVAALEQEEIPDVPMSMEESSPAESPFEAIENHEELSAEEPVDGAMDNDIFSTDAPVAEAPVFDESIDPRDPLGLQKFEESGGTELSLGEFLYEVTVSGVDSQDLRKEVQIALADKRFGFSQEDLRQSLMGGVLTLKNLNPVRAMLVVLKLQTMDLQIEWHQKHFTQSEETSGDEADV